MNCTAHIDKENGRGDPSPTKKGGSLEKPSPQVGRWVCEANSDEVEGEFVINTSSVSLCSTASPQRRSLFARIPNDTKILISAKRIDNQRTNVRGKTHINLCRKNPR